MNTKRTQSILTFATQLDSKLRALSLEMSGSENPYKGPRIVQINAPFSKGEVEVVLEHPEWSHRHAIYLRPDGGWSGLCYWSAIQI